MVMRTFIALIILLAIIVGLLVVSVQPGMLVKIFYYRDFFDVTLPILAFGALIKYLCTPCIKCKSCHDNMHCKCCSKIVNTVQ